MQSREGEWEPGGVRSRARVGTGEVKVSMLVRGKGSSWDLDSNAMANLAIDKLNLPVTTLCRDH